MKTKAKLLVLSSLLATSVFLIAQDGPPPGRGGGQGGPGGQRPPAPPVITALDANQDGVIDASEIANASAALKKLDKNGDGKLTPDEFMGQRPGGQGGQGGPGGQGNRPQRPSGE
jgi:hypothetical protein